MQVTFAKRSSGSSLTSTSFNSPLVILFLFHLLLQSRLWSINLLKRKINHLSPPASFLRFCPAADIFPFPISSFTDIVSLNTVQTWYRATWQSDSVQRLWIKARKRMDRLIRRKWLHMTCSLLTDWLLTQYFSHISSPMKTTFGRFFARKFKNRQKLLLSLHLPARRQINVILWWL